ncbi:MAPEG family protein [Arenimonas sp.]|uniref:MAPEG family protein n=1 Tax=Arenimonas sp. TaxID=1872635 RepID=UPI0039E70872
MVTMFYTGLCVLLVLLLSVRVAAWRFRQKIDLGDGGDSEMLRRMRAHGNAAEHMPLALLLLGGLELNGYDARLIHTFGGVFVASRALHAFAVSSKSGLPGGRLLGMAFTWLPMLAMAVLAIYGYFQQGAPAP